MIENLSQSVTPDTFTPQDVTETTQPAAENSTSESATQSQNLSSKQLNKIAKLHKECAKYRSALNSSVAEKANLQKLLDDTKLELDALVKQNLQKDILLKLKNLGCLKPNLVINDIPADCHNLDDFISQYKQNNPFLFAQSKSRHGFSFKSVNTHNYSSSQQMNNCIRSALGR